MLSSSRLALLPPLLLSLVFSHVVSASAEPFFRSDAHTPQESAVREVLEYTPAESPDAECAKLRPTGPIETTHCDYEAVDGVNEQLFDKLHELVQTPFFRYFKVDLYRDCPFWVDDGLCMQRECGVASLDESEVPERWRAAELSRVHKEDPNAVRLPGCYSGSSDYCFLDDGVEGEYIDLAMNQEGYTGYAGPKAWQVWSAIYKENCFGISEDHTIHEKELEGKGLSPTSSVVLEKESDEEECLEKKVFYRVVSGLHASISTHICHVSLDKATGLWSPNLDCFTERIASHPERLHNMYLDTVLLLRAVARVGPYISSYNLQHNMENETDAKTNGLFGDVLDIAQRVGNFDESALFAGSDAMILKREFKEHFRNVSRIMDCVGCDKCRLWGKVQITGLAAAMKVLFEMDESSPDPALNKNLLSRWETVALLNVLHRLSESLHATEDFRRMWVERKTREREQRSSSSSSPVGVKGKGQQPLPPHSYPATSPARSPSSSSPSASSRQSQRTSTIPIPVQLQDLGRTVYDVCKRSTIGCMNVLSSFVRGLARMLVGDKDSGRRERTATGGEL